MAKLAPSVEENAVLSQSTVIPVRRDFSLDEILSCVQELYNWSHEGLPSDVTAIESVLMLRSVCKDFHSSWPLVLDPHDQLQTWCSVLQTEERAQGGYTQWRTPGEFYTQKDCRSRIRGSHRFGNGVIFYFIR